MFTYLQIQPNLDQNSRLVESEDMEFTDLECQLYCILYSKSLGFIHLSYLKLCILKTSYEMFFTAV